MDKLLAAGFIREIKYPEWLANVVVVAKKGGNWIVCVDYTDLNKAYPKDSFPLPQINQIVDASAGHGMLSFLDAFSGYHQIPMHSPDMEKTTFITPYELFCNNVMPFGLKNAVATYQRLVEAPHSRPTRLASPNRVRVASRVHLPKNIQKQNNRLG